MHRMRCRNLSLNEFHRLLASCSSDGNDTVGGTYALSMVMRMSGTDACFERLTVFKARLSPWRAEPRGSGRVIGVHGQLADETRQLVNYDDRRKHFRAFPHRVRQHVGLL